MANILIFGAGALGQALGGLLVTGGHHVDFIIRQRYAAALSRNGLRITGVFGDHFVPPEDLLLHNSIEAVEENDYDFVLVCVKSYDTGKAVREILKIRRQTFTTVSLQNGYGNFEILRELLGEERVLGGRVITGFEIVQPGEVRVTVHADAIHIGGLGQGTIPEKARILAKIIDEAGIPAEVTGSIDKDRWAKILYNCALNSLGAVLGANYGTLAGDGGVREIMDDVVREIFRVMDAIGASTHWKTPEEYLDIFYKRQIPATHDHFPSMLQDLKACKATEIDALNGAIVRLGKEQGISAPVNTILTSLIRFMEKRLHS